MGACHLPIFRKRINNLCFFLGPDRVTKRNTWINIKYFSTKYLFIRYFNETLLINTFMVLKTKKNALNTILKAIIYKRSHFQPNLICRA